jgi:serine/threonine-protein kinase
MEPEVWQRIKSVFDSVVLVQKSERSAYLRKVCSGDPELRREVEALLASYDQADSFMEKPFAGQIADVLTPPAATDLAAGATLDHYKILRKVGSGGMGKVYLAEDTQLRRSVAIKLLSPEATADKHQVARFVQEARLASLLNHPNILTIYEVGQNGGSHFISSEFVSGDTLRGRISDGPLAVKDAIDIAIQIASALAVAHRGGVVHRDIKPENVMLREDGLLKVLDFGLAKLNRNERSATDHNGETWGDVRTKPGIILGTVTYMSPEQAGGSEVDARTDIWSLGVVLYEMISGRPPFSGSSAANVMQSILRVEPKPLNHPTPDLRRTLRRIIKRSLAKSLDERYRSIEEMLDDLRCFRTQVEAGAAGPRSVAILPFTNITRDARVSFFEFALADAVITELARSQSLVVRPSSSVAKYLGQAVDPVAIGRELQVDAILTANFLHSKDRIRVTTQLIDVEDKNVLWAEQIDSDTDDVIGLQDLITNRIVEGLKCELESPALADFSFPVTTNSRAYTEYLRGRDQLRRYMFHTVANEDVEIAIGHFKTAIELDSQFALAHCALGTSYMQRVIKVVGCRDDVEAAAVQFDRALALDPGIVDARAYRAFILRLQGETRESRNRMAELRRDAPNNFEVQYLNAACYRFDGDYENALQCYVEMLRLDPTAQVAVHYCRARIFLYKADLKTAFREIELAQKLEPNHPIVKFFHAILILRSGHPAVAAEEMRSLFSTYPSIGFRPYLSMCLSALGDREAAMQVLTPEIEAIAAVDPDVSYWLASANLLAGQTDTAFKWLRTSIWLGNNNLPWFESDPVWASMRTDSRFASAISTISRTL